jgi:putative aldouronate transport system substrate-binding protein
MKRFITKAATLCGVLFILAGCGGKKAAVSSMVESEPGPLGKYKEPLSITWGVSTSAVQQFPPGDSYTSNDWTREFRDSLNINLQVAFTADGGSGAFENQLNLAIASGDLPDILRIPNYKIFEQGARAGLWADLSQIYDQYGNDWMKMIKGKYPTAFQFASIDGKLYGVPPVNNDNREYASLLWIRDDWLKNLNLKPPATIDELIEVARAFTFNDPDKNGRNDTFGLGLQNLLVVNNFAHLCGFFSAYGIPSFNHSSYYRGPDGKVTFSYLEPAMKDALKVLVQMYKEGIFDTEFTVKDSGKILEDMTSGRIGMEYGLNYNTWWGFNGLYSNSGVIVHPYPIPVIPGIRSVLAHESAMASGEITVISSRFSNPEALIKMFNLHNTLVNPDMSDAIFNRLDADEKWRLTPALIYESQNMSYPFLYKPAFESGDPSGLPTNLIAKYNQIVGFANGTDTKADSYGNWGQFYPGNAMTIILENYIPQGWLQESLLGPVWPQALLDYDASLQKITVQALTEIITGVRPVEYFDQYVQDWLRAGGQQVLNELDALYPAR